VRSWRRRKRSLGMMFGAKVAIAGDSCPQAPVRSCTSRCLSCVVYRVICFVSWSEPHDSVPPADRLRAALPLGTNRAP